MSKTGAELLPGSPEYARWTLIRGARQLLTLRGPSGPRRGSAMSDLSIISDGALLIRDGIIEEAGQTRRIENLAHARYAREIDAAGKVVMPAFVDPDIGLAVPSAGGYYPEQSSENDIRRVSSRRLLSEASSIAADLVAFGVLTVGAHTLQAPDLQNTRKALRMHQIMQSKPLRIRSVFSPGADLRTTDAGRQQIGEVWMPAIFRKKLASLLEVPVASSHIEAARRFAAAAAAAGYNIRMRVSGPTTTEVLELAYSAGAVSLIGAIPEPSNISRALADLGCVKVILASRLLDGGWVSKRRAVDEGTPIALASGYRRDGDTSMNPQFLLYLATHGPGISIEEAIVAVTYNAAYSLRLSHVTGSLAPGKSADICIMNVGDYRELTRRAGHHDVSLVMRAGKVVYRRPGLTMD
jgi:imidazolonepropionase